jgi:hypothetical protein
VQPLWKAIWRLLKKLKIDLPYNPAIPLLGINPKEYESCYYKGTYTPMFIAALVIIAKLWKQPRCPTNDKWIKKMWCLYTMEFYSVTKKNEILSFTGKWLNQSGPEGKKPYVLSCMQNIYLEQIQQYYRTWVTLRGGRVWER